MRWPCTEEGELRSLLNWWASEHDADVADDLDPGEVLNDGDRDVLTGGAGADWFIVGSGDRITDLQQGGLLRNRDLITVVP